MLFGMSNDIWTEKFDSALVSVGTLSALLHFCIIQMYIYFCSLPGDYGFDPLGLSDPEGTGGFIEPKWLAYGEVINGRYAMLGAVGAIAPEILGKAGLIPQETALAWFQTGVIDLKAKLGFLLSCG